MLAPGKMQEIARELGAYSVDITGLQEIRWSGQGKIDKQKYAIWYAGEEKQGYGGTAFIVTGKMKDQVIQFMAVSGRISYIRIKNKPHNLSIINVYAPTEKADIERKQEFYDQLEDTFNKIPKQDRLIILGDFNAQIGKEQEYREVADINTAP